MPVQALHNVGDLISRYHGYMKMGIRGYLKIYGVKFFPSTQCRSTQCYYLLLPFWLPLGPQKNRVRVPGGSNHSTIGTHVSVKHELFTLQTHQHHQSDSSDYNTIFGLSIFFGVQKTVNTKPLWKMLRYLIFKTLRNYLD